MEIVTVKGRSRRLMYIMTIQYGVKSIILSMLNIVDFKFNQIT